MLCSPASVSMKEGNVSFNDALNTFYLRLYGVRQKDEQLQGLQDQVSQLQAQLAVSV